LKRFTLNLSSTDLIFGAIFLLAAILFVIGYNWAIMLVWESKLLDVQELNFAK
jgi:hypothetical protein